MKYFITVNSPDVDHGDDTVSFGVYGLEGSKPGAASVGILLSHRVSHFYEVAHMFQFFCSLIKHNGVCENKLCFQNQEIIILTMHFCLIANKAVGTK